MIKSITVTNPAGDSLKLELRRPEESGFAVLGVEGLGPCRADINLADIATMDGSYFTSSRLSSRNIVLTLKLLEKPTIEDARQRSYWFFPVKKKISLLFETDNRLCQITGYVESTEVPIFSAQQVIQISIMCPDPYFYSTSLNISRFAFSEPNFEFPFENDSITDPLLEVGIMDFNTEKIIVYPGDADIGMLMTIHTTGQAENVSTRNITIYNVLTGEQMVINTALIETITGEAFGVLGHPAEILISTMRGQKQVYLLREGNYTNIFGCIGKDSDWLTLTKGNNVIAYTADSQISDLTFTIKSYVAYLGV